MDSYLRSRKVRLLSALLTLAIVIGVIPIKKIKADSGSTTENDLQITYKTVSAWGNMTQSEVTVENKDKSIVILPADNVIMSVGYHSTPLLEASKTVHLLGDCKKVGNVRSAIWGAWEIAMKI